MNEPEIKHTAIDFKAMERQRDMEVYVLTYEAFLRKWKPADPREQDRFAADLANLLRIHLADATKELHKVIGVMAEAQRMSTLLPRP